MMTPPFGENSKAAVVEMYETLKNYSMFSLINKLNTYQLLLDIIFMWNRKRERKLTVESSPTEND